MKTLTHDPFTFRVGDMMTALLFIPENQYPVEVRVGNDTVIIRDELSRARFWMAMMMTIQMKECDLANESPR